VLPVFRFSDHAGWPAEGRLTLALSGRDGVKEFIRSEFEGLLPMRF
jgi:hypothetical protein